jgi:NDP-sugar pyrophosphorylase family protein
MKVVILAGGKGTRLAPYTTVLPKPLVPVADLPIVEILIRQFAYRGFADIALSIGYLGQLIRAYFSNGHLPPGVNLSYVVDPTPLGTAGSLALVPGLTDTFLVANGDVLTTLDFRRLVEYHREHKGILTVAMHQKEVKIDLGVMEVDGQSRVVAYSEKPVLRYRVSMGIYVYEPAVLRYIPPGQYLDFPNLVLRLLAGGERVNAYPSDDFWLDIGRHEDYARATEEFEKRRADFHVDSVG